MAVAGTDQLSAAVEWGGQDVGKFRIGKAGMSVRDDAGQRLR